MTDAPQPNESDRMDAPNQQAVRADQSGPGDEGAGGRRGAPAQYAGSAPARSPATGTGGPSQYADPAEPAKALDDMTKDELLAEAQRRGATADASMTKAEIREALGA
jgi:hypothetical protein